MDAQQQRQPHVPFMFLPPAVRGQQLAECQRKLNAAVQDVKAINNKVRALIGTSQMYQDQWKKWQTVTDKTRELKASIERIDGVLAASNASFHLDSNNDPASKGDNEVERVMSNPKAVPITLVNKALALVARHFGSLDPIRNISPSLRNAFLNVELEPLRARVEELENHAPVTLIPDSQYESGTQLELRELKARFQQTISTVVREYQDPVIALQEYINRQKETKRELGKAQIAAVVMEDERNFAIRDLDHVRTRLGEAEDEIIEAKNQLKKANLRCDSLLADVRERNHSITMERRRRIELEGTIRIMEKEAMEQNERARLDMDQYGTWMSWDTAEQEQLRNVVHQLVVVVLDLRKQLIQAGQNNLAGQQLGQIIEELLDGYSALKVYSENEKIRSEQDLKSLEVRIRDLERDMKEREKQMSQSFTAQSDKLKAKEAEISARSEEIKEKDTVISKLSRTASAQFDDLKGNEERIADLTGKLREKDDELAGVRKDFLESTTNYCNQSQTVLTLQTINHQQMNRISSQLAEIEDLKRRLACKDSEISSLTEECALQGKELQSKTDTITATEEQLYESRQLREDQAAMAEVAAAKQESTIKAQDQRIEELKLDLIKSTASRTGFSAALFVKTKLYEQAVSSAAHKDLEFQAQLQAANKELELLRVRCETEAREHQSNTKALQKKLDDERVISMERNEEIRALNDQVAEKAEDIKNQALAIKARDATIKSWEEKLKQKQNELEITKTAHIKSKADYEARAKVQTQTILESEMESTRAEASRLMAIRRACFLLCDLNGVDIPDDISGWVEVVETFIFDAPVDLPLTDFEPRWSMNMPYDQSLLSLDSVEYSPTANIILLHMMIAEDKIHEPSAVRHLHVLSKHIITCDSTILRMAIVTIKSYCSKLSEAAQSEEEAVVAMMMIQIYNIINRRSQTAWERIGSMPKNEVVDILETFICKGPELTSKVHQVIKLANSNNANSLDEFKNSISGAVEARFDTLAVTYDTTTMVTETESPFVILMDMKRSCTFTLIAKSNFEISEEHEYLLIGPRYLVDSPKGASLPNLEFQNRFDNAQADAWWDRHVLSYGPIPPDILEMVERFQALDAVHNLDDMDAATFLALAPI